MKKKLTFAFVVGTLAMALGLAACNTAGAKGEKGDKGDKGDPGAPGEPGEPGEDLRVEPFTVTFDSQGGTPVEPVQMDHIGRIPKPQDPIMVNYMAFTGWYTEPECEVEWIFSKDVAAEDTTLYAGWTFDSANYSSRVAAVQSTTADSQFTVWTDSTWRGHVKGSWNTGCTINMSWRTIAIFDGNGTLAYGVYCPANGYGSPAGSGYMRDPIYADPATNPVFVFGETYPTDAQDFELVIPQGGFAITAHTDGANTLATLMTNGVITEAGNGLNELGASAKCATYLYAPGEEEQEPMVAGVYKRYFLDLEGTSGGKAISDICEYSDQDYEYTVKATLTQWGNVTLRYGTMVIALGMADYRGAIKSEGTGADWTDRLYAEDNSGKFYRGASGEVTYVFTLNERTGLIAVAIEGKFGTLATGGYRSVAIENGVAQFTEEWNQWNRLNGWNVVKDGKAVYGQFNKLTVDNSAAQSVYVANDSDPLYQLITNAAGNFQFTFDYSAMKLTVSAVA